MSGKDDLREPPASPEEIAAARLFARVLEGEGGGVADPEPLAVARLLETAGGTATSDQVSRLRLRRQLVRAAGRSRWYGWTAAAAALLLIGIALTVVWRGDSVPSAGLLDERERVARAAVAGLLERQPANNGLVASAWNRARSAHVAAAVASDRLERLHSAALLDTIDASSDSARPETLYTPFPGGSS